MVPFKKLKTNVKRTRASRFLLIPFRLKLAIGYYWPALKRIPRWLMKSSEISNFTYDTTDQSKDCLASLASLISGLSPVMIRSFIDELDNDTELQTHLDRETQGGSDYTADLHSKPGKRAAYYVLVRSLKPSRVVEVGVDKGMGTCVIAAALKKNEAEGRSGKVYGIDVDANAGYLFKAPYERYGTIVTSIAAEFVSKVDEQIDIFINDALQNSKDEGEVLALLKDKLSKKAVLVSVWHTGALMQFAWATERHYIMFREIPKEHWYPGSPLVFAFPSNARNV